MKSKISNNGIYLLLACFVCLIIPAGCNKDNTDIPDSNPIEVTKTGCKTFILATDSFKLDCIEYKIMNRILYIKHINAAFNCCPKRVYAIANISGDSISITEKEILEQPCDCNCLFDLEYAIPNITDSNYIVIINEPYITNDSDKIIFVVNPMLSSAGTYCKTRSIYPWD